MNDTQLRPDTLVTVGVVNRSTLLSAANWAPMAGLVNVQLANDFGPAWGIWWALAEATEDAIASYRVQIVIVDELPEAPAGVLGFHNETAAGGIRGYVAVKPVLDAGGVPLLDPERPQRPTVLSVLSHEVLEAAVDPFCADWSLGPERNEGALYAKEIGDPVESLQYTVALPSGERGAVSDFCLPAFFDPRAAPGTKVDFIGQCPGPFQLTTGGYMSVMSAGYQLAQIYADNRRPWKHEGKATSLRSRHRAAHVARLCK